MEFTIKDYKELFRVSKITPIELLSITTQIDLEDYTKTFKLYTFCLEHCEVCINEKWLPVKTKDREIYWPAGIDNNLNAINEICTFMLNEVIAKAFQKSSE